MASPGERIAANIRAERARAGIGQADVVERMRNLGYTNWHRQTMGKVEQGERRVLAEEILGLAVCLGTTVPKLFDGLVSDEWGRA